MSVLVDSTSTNQGVNFLYPSHLDNISPLTACAWIYPTGWGQSSWGRVIAKETGSVGWFLMVDDFNQPATLSFLRTRTVANAQTWGAADTLVLNKWQHVAVTYQSSGHVLYVDGSPISTYTYNPGSGGFNSDSSAYLIAGNRTPYGRGFKGRIEDVRVYERYLSPEEIMMIFIARGHDQVIDKLGHWPLNEGVPGTTTGTSYDMKDRTENLAHGRSIYTSSSWGEGVLTARRRFR